MKTEKENYREQVSSMLNIPLEDVVIEDLYVCEESGAHHFKLSVKLPPTPKNIVLKVKK